MAKPDLSQMMQQRSPLVEREIIEPVELYTNSSTVKQKVNKKARLQGPEFEKMKRILKTKQKENDKFNLNNYTVDRTTEPDVTKYTTHLAPMLIKAIKRFALEADLKDYEVVQTALIEYLDEHDSLT